MPTESVSRRTFDVNLPPEFRTLYPDASGAAEVTFAVKNNKATPVRGRMRLVPKDGTDAGWLVKPQNEERDFRPGESQQFKVGLNVPAGVAPGTYGFRIDVANVANPQEDFTEGDMVAFAVAPTAGPPPRRQSWLIPVIAAVGLLVAGGIVAAVVLTRGDKGPTTGPVAAATSPATAPTTTPTTTPAPPELTCTTTNMPMAARENIHVAIVGTKAIFGGGGRPGRRVGRAVDIYDTASKEWSTIQLPSAGRQYIGMAAVGAKVMFAGGGTPTGEMTDVVEIYDVVTGAWSTTKLPSGPRFLLSGTSVGMKALFAGGGPEDAPTMLVDIYDAAAGGWTTTTRPSEPRMVPAAVTAGTKAIFAGGIMVSGNSITPRSSASVDIYDSTTGAWSTTVLPSGPRELLAATAVGTKVLFAGGGSSAVDIYDVATNQWVTPVPVLPSGPASPLAMATVGTRAIFAGGRKSPPTDEADVYDVATGRWSKTKLAGGPRYEMTGTTMGAAAIFVGGRNDDSQVPSPAVDILSFP